MSTQAAETLRISTPPCEKGIGAVIRSREDSGLIDGVRLQAYDVWPDDRGYFLEVIRMRQGLAAHFDPDTTQVSAALSYPATIKAFHFHRHQSDLWVPMYGMFQVALVDLRTDSPTFGVKNTLYLGALRPWQVLIPPGVGHGYKVIGDRAGLLIYVTSRLYDPKDEGRIAFDDPAIQYDWETQHK